MSEHSNCWMKLSGIIDLMNTWVAKIFCFCLIPITLFAVFEVFMRYVVSKPTIWVWDINVQLMATVTLLGLGFALLRGQHIRIELLTERLSDRGKSIIAVIVNPILIVVFFILTWQIGLEAIESVYNNEISVSYFAPPLYPLKIIMAIGSLLLLLQGISELIKSIHGLRKLNIKAKPS